MRTISLKLSSSAETLLDTALETYLKTAEAQVKDPMRTNSGREFWAEQVILARSTLSQFRKKQLAAIRREAREAAKHSNGDYE